MIISDLSYLEATNGNEINGGSYYSYYQNDKVKLDIKTDIDLDDNSAEAFADAKAEDYYSYSDNTFTKTFTFAYTNDWKSVSSSGSFAATD